MKSHVTCGTCHRDSQRMNSAIAECSHVECPHRRHAWSERPSTSFKGPWPTNTDADPVPLDVAVKGRS